MYDTSWIPQLCNDAIVTLFSVSLMPYTWEQWKLGACPIIINLYDILCSLIYKIDWLTAGGDGIN